MSPPAGTDVARAARLIRAGALVAFATETVYGLGAHALDETAIARVFEAKNRPRFDPLIVHVPDRCAADPLVSRWPRLAERLAEAFWPGPLTLVLPKSALVPDLATAGLPSVAIRVPGHPLALELLRRADVPVAAPSANPFGGLSPTTAAHVAAGLGDKVDYILDGGPCQVGVESTILAVDDAGATLLRPGGVALEDCAAVAGPIAVAERLPGRPDEAALAPGMLESHYAPKTPMSLVDGIKDDETGATERVGILAFQPCESVGRYAAREVLSPTGDLVEAAANFFAALRRLDEAGVDRIVAVRLPQQGLGRAMNDRLQRGAAERREL
jgi:L-threonylcarbamoyladenylate synthase